MEIKGKVPYNWEENPNFKMTEEEIKEAEADVEYLTSCFVKEEVIHE